MRTPEEWFEYHHKTKPWTPGDPPAVLQLLRLAMADAARSERERCAKCAEGEATDSPIVVNIGRMIAHDIRALPDAPAEKGEG